MGLSPGAKSHQIQRQRKRLSLKDFILQSVVLVALTPQQYVRTNYFTIVTSLHTG